MPKNILYFHDREWIAGAEQSLFQFVSRLDKSKFLPFFVLAKEGEFSRILEKERIPVRIVPFHPFRSFRWDGILKTFLDLRKVVRETYPHLLHSNTPRTNLYAGVLGRLHKTPVVWHARNLLYGNMMDTDRLFLFLAKKIVCNSDAIRNRFKQSEKAVTIHSGVDCDKFKPDDTKGRTFRGRFQLGEASLVGLIARVGLGKGHEIFLGAAAKAHEAFPKTRFLIVGRAENKEDEEREKKLRELSVRLGISDVVSFLGYQEDMPSVMSALDLVVVATEAEPFGRVILEAMAAGKPVIGTASGGTPELIQDGENGLLVPPRDERAIAKAILALLRNPLKAKEMGERGRKRILSDFTIDRHVKKIEGLYQELIG